MWQRPKTKGTEKKHMRGLLLLHVLTRFGITFDATLFGMGVISVFTCLLELRWTLMTCRRTDLCVRNELVDCATWNEVETKTTHKKIKNCLFFLLLLLVDCIIHHNILLEFVLFFFFLFLPFWWQHKRSHLALANTCEDWSITMPRMVSDTFESIRRVQLNHVECNQRNFWRHI